MDLKQPEQYFGLPGHGPRPISRLTVPPGPPNGPVHILQRGGLGIDRHIRRSRLIRRLRFMSALPISPGPLSCGACGAPGSSLPGRVPLGSLDMAPVSCARQDSSRWVGPVMHRSRVGVPPPTGPVQGGTYRRSFTSMSQSSRVRRGFRALSVLGVTALILTIGAAPIPTSGADHLDAPSLGSISVNPNDSLNVSKVRGPLDINDVYVFRGSSSRRTVLVMTVNPAINVLGPTTFQQGAKYFLNVDTGTDAIADLRIRT